MVKAQQAVLIQLPNLACIGALAHQEADARCFQPGPCPLRLGQEQERPVLVGQAGSDNLPGGGSAAGIPNLQQSQAGLAIKRGAALGAKGFVGCIALKAALPAAPQVADIVEDRGLLARRGHRSQYSGRQLPSPRPAGPGFASFPPKARHIDLGFGPCRVCLILDPLGAGRYFTILSLNRLSQRSRLGLRGQRPLAPARQAAPRRPFQWWSHLARPRACLSCSSSSIVLPWSSRISALGSASRLAISCSLRPLASPRASPGLCLLDRRPTSRSTHILRLPVPRPPRRRRGPRVRFRQPAHRSLRRPRPRGC